MASVTRKMHVHFDAQLAEALQVLHAGRRFAADTVDYLAFSAALTTVEECREAIEFAANTETLSRHLRTAREALGKMDSLLARYADPACMAIAGCSKYSTLPATGTQIHIRRE